MGAGTLTLRIGTQLVGLRADTDSTLARLRALLAIWIDHTYAVPWVFDVRLEPSRSLDDSPVGRGPRSVPQLRLGQVLMARSRDADDVLHALGSVLGGVLAHQDEELIWSGMRAFASTESIVLVDARAPALSADPALVRSGIRELPTWSVAIDASAVRIPPPLTGLDWGAAGLDAPSSSTTTWRSAPLAGIVALDPAPQDHDHDHDHDHEEDHDHDHEEHSSRSDGNTDAALLSRFAARHPSPVWFATVEGLIRDGRVSASSDRSVVRQQIIELAGR